MVNHFSTTDKLMPALSVSGLHQQQEGGSVLQLHREQVDPQVFGQQPM